MTKRDIVALIGASGFVGGLLIRPLAGRVGELRCVSRRPERIAGPLPDDAKPVRADLLEPQSLDAALAGASVAYYLAHSLDESAGFEALERQAAHNFARAAKAAGLRRIVYLGALSQAGSADASAHVETRHRVGDILRESGVPVTEFRASIVIGPRSMPFEVVRALVERLPVMVTPRWVRQPIQPVAAADLVAYLVAALEADDGACHVYEIGGSEAVTYGEVLRAYARARGLRRLMVPVPVVTPRLSSLWLKLVTPAHFRMGRRIVESAEHSSLVRDSAALRDFAIRPMSLAEAIQDALEREEAGLAFLDEGSDGLVPPARQHFMSGTRFVERRVVALDGDRRTAFEVVSSVGGDNGWFWGDWLWALRGAMDRLVGGPGLRRGRPQGRAPAPGDRIDFWTVERYAEGDRITLRADMRLPGRAWLDLRVREGEDGVRLQQTAGFAPKGVLGILYWLLLYPIHELVFDRMVAGMRDAVSRGGRAAPRGRATA